MQYNTFTNTGSTIHFPWSGGRSLYNRVTAYALWGHVSVFTPFIGFLEFPEVNIALPGKMVSKIYLEMITFITIHFLMVYDPSF